MDVNQVAQRAILDAHERRSTRHPADPARRDERVYTRDIRTARRLWEGGYVDDEHRATRAGLVAAGVDFAQLQQEAINEHADRWGVPSVRDALRDVFALRVMIRNETVGLHDDRSRMRELLRTVEDYLRSQR